ncbi:cadmium resistance transporter [Nostoc sp. FACHB-152]|uniref:cadmium resistance transporter n=1 Tax=unclassified Nostoc TaxID=2593658 RepID=UPI001686DC2A|nr:MULTISPECIES: cadmium resistance transporter [unclassified Nostoc]MBD2446250.1 cadmium resistance transporter [Nostoc sp. FACHB-152]MBD2469520.1 cadmium resistance transporter [Nostoc sp. FACHB-145]
MNEIITAISTGVVAFISTNIDDIAILLLFFSQINAHFRPQHIFFGQYLGFIVLVVLSLSGLLGGFVLGANWIGLLGLIPIAIGISSLVNHEDDDIEELVVETMPSSEELGANFIIAPQTYTVAAVTIANGGDNISIYIPLFASSNLTSFWVIIGVFFLLLGVLCYTAYKLTHQQAIADAITRYISNFVPFILICLGAFIIFKTEALSLIKLAASCCCLIVLLKK